MILITILNACLRDPVIIVRRTHFMGISILQRPAHAGNKYSRAILQDLGFTLF